MPMNNSAHSKTGTTFTVKFTLLHPIMLKLKKDYNHKRSGKYYIGVHYPIKLSLVMNDHSFVIKVATTL